jgi:peroxiredoxin
MTVRKIFYCSIVVLLISFTPALSAETGKEELFQKIKIQHIKEDSKAPHFCLENLRGGKMELRNCEGKVVFLNFWATWCGPCKEEMPSIETLHQKFKQKDFVFLTISVDYEGKKPVKEFIERKRYTFPVLLDPKCEILDVYKVTRIPTTFIIDKNRKIIGKATGPRDWKSPEVISLLDLFIGK